MYSSYTAGGAEKTLIELASALEKLDLKNIVAAPKGSYLLKKAEEKRLSSAALKINGSFDILGIFRLRNIILKYNIDAIHAHQGKVFWPCVFMKKFVKPSLKLVFHRHAQLAHRAYSRWHYDYADLVIAISKAVAQGLIEREKVPAEKVLIIYNGIELSRFNTGVDGKKIRAKLGFEGKIVAGTAAAMNRPKGKGQEYLLEAAKLLKKKNPLLRIMIAGDGQIRGELEEKSRELGVDDITVFTGYVENIEEYMAAMDIFCLLSWDTEGLGQVLMEAQALGKPVIGTKVGGVPETFINGKTGILINPENPEELAIAIETLASDAGKMAAMGKEAAAYAADNFGIEKMAARVALAYAGISEA